MGLTLGELAVRFGCELRGDPTMVVERVGTLAGATLGELAFLANPHYRSQLATTRATVVVLDAANAPLCPTAALIHSNPYATYARIASLLYPEPPAAAGAGPGVQIDASARVAASASIGAGTVIGPRCTIGERVRIGAGCVLGADVQVGDDCRLHARVTLESGTELGARVRLQSGAVVGSDGFGYARDGEAWSKVPQLGRVRIGADAEIGANTTIDRGALADTIIGNGVKLDNQIQIGHNVVVGDHTAMAGCVGIAGSAKIGKHCQLGGGAIVLGHLEIADGCQISAMTLITKSIAQPGTYTSVMPFMPHGEWLKNASQVRRLGQMADKIRKLRDPEGET
jgi:UDP-3-O-[3-hydroxymyristoyl] glucosamine N-acyltransferase